MTEPVEHTKLKKIQNWCRMMNSQWIPTFVLIQLCRKKNNYRIPFLIFEINKKAHFSFPNSRWFLKNNHVACLLHFALVFVTTLVITKAQIQKRKNWAKQLSSSESYYILLFLIISFIFPFFFFYSKQIIFNTWIESKERRAYW